MNKATSNIGNAHYNDEVLFLDGIIEFHKEAYDSLSDEDKRLFEAYYLVDVPTPENIFEYRSQLLAEQPEIEAEAKVAFARLLETLHITDFAYTTKWN